MTSELAVRPPEEDAAYGLARAEEVFTPERRAAIAQFLSIDGENPALVPYLAVCARYGLDPIMGQVWLIPQKVKVKDAEGRTQEVEKLKPTAGRDGYLAIARRQPDYQGVVGDVVHANDRFQVRIRRPEDPADLPDAGNGRVVVHEYPDLQDVRRGTPEGQEWDPVRYRGPIIGAYAVCYLRDRKPIYYYASIAEHGKTWGSGSNKGWAGAWTYTSTMIMKAAQSYVLRIACGITGIVPADEIQEGNPEAEMLAAGWDPATVLPGFVPGDMAARFKDAVEESWDADPNLWNRAKLEMYAPALKDVEEVEALIARIEKETEEERARGAEEEAVVDAEVVLSDAERASLEEELANTEEALESPEGLAALGLSEEEARERAAEVRDLLSS